MFYYGVIEDNQDPKNLGRVRVRIFGIHTHNKEGLPTENLTWSYIAQPTTSSNFGINQFSVPEQGTTVMGIFTDKYKQNFLVTAVIPVSYDELPDFSKGFTDKDGKYPKENFMKNIPEVIEETQEKDFSDEPDFDYTSTYPKRKFIYRDGDNEVYIDNTENNNNIAIKHKTGTELRILKDGSFVIKSKNDMYISALGKTTINSSSDVKVNSSGEVFITGTKIKLN